MRPREARRVRALNLKCELPKSINAFVAELARVPTTQCSDLNSGEFSYDL